MFHRHHRHAHAHAANLAKHRRPYSELKEDGSDEAARAIMTSDTKPKTIALRVPCGDGHFTIGGIAKGQA